METASGMDSDSGSQPDGYSRVCTTFHIADSDSGPTTYIHIGQESESKSVLGSLTGNVNDPLVWVMWNVLYSTM